MVSAMLPAMVSAMLPAMVSVMDACNGVWIGICAATAAASV